MNAKSLGRIIVLAVGLVCIFAGYVQADELQLLEKLSTDVDIQLKNVTIGEALGVIGRQAGVKFLLSDEAVWKLPHGEGTRLSVTLEGPLADGMTEMLNAFFMRYAVGEEEITIYPRAELEHILGRPSTKQLELLTKIYSMSISVKSGVSRDVVVGLIKDAFGAVSFVPYYVSENMYEVLESMGTPVTLAVLIEQAGFVQNTPHWYLSGMDFPDQIPTIRVVNEQAFREAKLDQVVDISFKNETATVILQRLAGWAGMELTVDKKEPSWLEGEIIVNMQNIKLRQALRNIVSSVDGEVYIDVGDNDIRIQGPRLPQKIAAPRKAKSSGGTAEGYVGKISIPMDGGKYFIEFMLRESDLTEELKKLRDKKIKEVSGKSAEPAATPQK
ncbi:MAG: hypothetical protein ACYSYV_11805 [Planctomycetota bacterium]|jgi:hypothetical protein